MTLPKINFKRLSLSYPKNVGFTEMMAFQDMATPEEKQLMDSYLEDLEDYAAAWELLKKVTHSDLQ